MPRHSISRMCAVLLVVSAWLVAVSAATAQQGGDRAMDLYRRQLQEREKRRQEMIERLRALPQPAPLPRAAPPRRPEWLKIQIRGRIRIASETFDADRGLTLESVAPRPEDDADPEDDAPARPAPQGIQTRIVAEENFDRWLFAGVDTEEGRRERLHLILDRMVNEASAVHRLTRAQAEKIRLAGRGDIKHFFDAVEERREEFDRDRWDLKAGLTVLQKIRPLIADFQDGPFGSGSIYIKTLTKILREKGVDRRLQ